MRFKKTLVLCSTSVAMLTLAAAPTWAQTPNPPGDPAAATAQEAPNNPDDVAPDVDDAVQGEEDADAEVESVVVTGLRRSLQSAQSIRRNSDQIVDSVVAEDIGKLPDVTASDSLARITGVQVERGGGEAGRVIVRGLPDVTTTYNGRDIFTAEARSVSIADFPAGGVAALEVYKSSTANLIEPGLAGLINVRSRRPFDFTDREIAGSVRFAYPNQSEDSDINYNLLFSDRWDTGAGEVGFLVNVSEQRLHFLDSARFNGGGLARIGADQTTEQGTVGLLFPDGVGIFQGEAERRRPSANASLQWRPNDDLEVYADFLYQGFRNEGADRIFFVPLGGGQYSNISPRLQGGSVAALTATGVGRPDGFQGAADGATDTYQVAVGAIWDRGPLRLSTDLAATDSVFDLSIFSFDYALTRGGTVNVIFESPEDENGGVDIRFQDLDTTDINNYIFRGFFDRHLVASGDDVQWRGDAQYDTGFDLIPQLEFGLRYVDRNGAFENGERYAPREGDRIPLSQFPLNFGLNPAGFNGSDVQLPRFIVPDRNSIRANGAALRDFVGFAPGRPPSNPVQEFEANEKSYAAYGQFDYEFQGAMPIDGVIGVRVVKTEVGVTGFSRTVEDGQEVFTPRNEQSEYTDVLPSATFRIRFTDALQGRLAANKTRTRPNFNQLNPGLQVDPTPDPVTGRFNARGGNVDLQPLESKNYDAALEYYFSRTGSATVTVFSREIEGFIQDQITDEEDPVIGPIRVTRPVNLNAQRIDGLEAAFTSFFDYDFLPTWAHGFGVQLNATFLDAEIRDISERAYNVIGMYEQGPVSARLAYNYRSQYRRLDRSAIEFVDDVSRLDFSASYTPFENVTLTFDASNILGEPYREFREFGGEAGTYPGDIRYEESIYSIGLRFRL